VKVAGTAIVDLGALGGHLDGGDRRQFVGQRIDNGQRHGFLLAPKHEGT